MSNFTSVVSSLVNNSDGSLKSGAGKTLKKLSEIFNNSQSIKLLSGTSLSNTAFIERLGQKIFIKDILSNLKYQVSELGSNIVSFGVGDVIGATTNGSLSISIDGYTKFELQANSKFKISEAGSNFLTYENLSGKVKYDFSKKPNFTYKVKGKTSIATIRGTVLEIETNDKNDTYNLIEGSIEVFNNKTKKSILLNAPSKVTI